MRCCGQRNRANNTLRHKLGWRCVTLSASDHSVLVMAAVLKSWRVAYWRREWSQGLYAKRLPRLTAAVTRISGPTRRACQKRLWAACPAGFAPPDSAKAIVPTSDSGRKGNNAHPAQ
ncbi:hypothetical protein KCP74_20820 [Salmonella enterica subsp. enterica]|nr:hypothetical protein KCP74_20820 [Salmonella enterica subsp. enterica]